ncbi:hypothetical protein K7432_006742 [Basidiobolus ranarum]|uniref:BHLH domain-containing protein n=1 Tax=Basidiobolus ranarum TaxID=34480 RepID=A0ABR2W1D2_9FUNG
MSFSSLESEYLEVNSSQSSTTTLNKTLSTAVKNTVYSNPNIPHENLSPILYDRPKKDSAWGLMPVDFCQFQSWITRGNYRSTEASNSKQYPSLQVNHGLDENTRATNGSFYGNLSSSNFNHEYFLPLSHYLVKPTVGLPQQSPYFSSQPFEQTIHNLTTDFHTKPTLNQVPTPIGSHNTTKYLYSNQPPSISNLSNQEFFSLAENEGGSNFRKTPVSQPENSKYKSYDLRHIIPDGQTATCETDPVFSKPLPKQNPWHLRKIYHRTAEQHRRDAFKDCLNELKDLIPGVSQKRQNKLILLRQVVDHVKLLQIQLSEKDKEIKRLREILEDFPSCLFYPLRMDIGFSSIFASS